MNKVFCLVFCFQTHLRLLLNGLIDRIEIPNQVSRELDTYITNSINVILGTNLMVTDGLLEHVLPRAIVSFIRSENVWAIVTEYQ